MALPESELIQPARSRYAVSVIGGDSVFLVDKHIGQKLHLDEDRPMSRPDFRRRASVAAPAQVAQVPAAAWP